MRFQNRSLEGSKISDRPLPIVAASGPNRAKDA
jgi:hypothetical protein